MLVCRNASSKIAVLTQFQEYIHQMIDSSLTNRSFLFSYSYDNENNNNMEYKQQQMDGDGGVIIVYC